MKKTNNPKPQSVYLVLSERILDGTTLIVAAFFNQQKAFEMAKKGFFRVVKVNVTI